MKAVEQPEESWAQFLLGLLHLHALAVASVAVYIHSRAVLHHFQRAGIREPDTPAAHDLSYAEALKARRPE